MRETWYVLEDGNMADPNEVAPDDSGALRHKSGIAVAMKGDVPHTSGVDAEEERAKKPGKAATAAPPNEARTTLHMKPVSEPKELQPEPAKSTYKTREVKAR